MGVTSSDLPRLKTITLGYNSFSESLSTVIESMNVIKNVI